MGQKNTTSKLVLHVSEMKWVQNSLVLHGSRMKWIQNIQVLPVIGTNWIQQISVLYVSQERWLKQNQGLPGIGLKCIKKNASSSCNQNELDQQIQYFI